MKPELVLDLFHVGTIANNLLGNYLRQGSYVTQYIHIIIQFRCSFSLVASDTTRMVEQDVEENQVECFLQLTQLL